MSQLPRALSRDLDVVQGARVTNLVPDGGGWRLRIDVGDHLAARLIVAIPAPQARDLPGANNAFAAPLAQVHNQANVTVMVGLDTSAPRPLRDAGRAGAFGLSCAGRREAGRGGPPLTTWVVQVDPDWSMANIALPFDGLADRSRRCCRRLARNRTTSATRRRTAGFMRALTGPWTSRSWPTMPQVRRWAATGPLITRPRMTGPAAAPWPRTCWRAEAMADDHRPREGRMLWIGGLTSGIGGRALAQGRGRSSADSGRERRTCC
ncbi:FAD-dependent oxidoreductase [Paracoccus beibuensis]|uniref:FAD-dependent oxidoreductase n=1 Tax=Paracoccus beibuensis TaxID=547602 RepID=UPI002240CCAE|nr:FAD-dependent oxidoreductase [Paracoccus beibuensis]